LEAGRCLDTLYIKSGDPERPLLGILLEGAGVKPPQIQVAPEQLSALFHPAYVVARRFTVKNLGASELVLHVSADPGSRPGGYTASLLGHRRPLTWAGPRGRERTSSGSASGGETSAAQAATDAWLAVDTTEAVLAPGESLRVSVFMDGRELDDGVYEGAVVLNSNDPDRPEVSVPVTLLVRRVQATKTRVEPRHLDRRSVGRWLYASVELPSGYKAQDIVLSSVILVPGVPADSAWCETKTRGRGSSARQWMKFRFDRGRAASVLPAGREVVVEVCGEISGRAWLTGVDSISVRGAIAGSAEGTSTGGEASPKELGLVGATLWTSGTSAEMTLNLPRESFVRLAVYDAAGRLVRTLVEGALPGGRHAVRWDGKDRSGRPAPAGVYFCRAETSEGVVSRKLVLVR